MMMHYHFCSINEKSLQNLFHNQIYFSKPKELNDPFDCRVFPQLVYKDEKARKKAGELEKLIPEDKRIWDGDFSNYLLNDLQESVSRNKILEKDPPHYRTFSLVGEKNDDGEHAKKNLLMWAHYADSHRGMCLGFEFSEEVREKLLEVKYCDVFKPLVISEEDIDLKRVASGTLPFSEKFVLELETRILTTKSLAWEYENEYRFIDPHKRDFFNYKDALKEVTFGVSCSERMEESVRKILEKKAYEIRYFQAKKIPGDFRLTIEPC